MDLFTANSLSTNRPSFAAANRAVTLTRVTNERLVRLGIGLTGRLAAGQFSSCVVNTEQSFRYTVLANK